MQDLDPDRFFLDPDPNPYQSSTWIRIRNEFFHILDIHGKCADASDGKNLDLDLFLHLYNVLLRLLISFLSYIVGININIEQQK